MHKAENLAYLRGVIAQWPQAVNGDTALLRRGRLLDVQFLLGLGPLTCHVSIRDGRIAAFDEGARLMRAWTFAIRGDDAVWRAFWQPLPAPTYNDVFALAKCHGVTIEGDLKPFMQYLMYFKGVLEAPRRFAGAA